MGANGYHAYDLTGQLEYWSNDDLLAYIADSETMMGLEKHHIIRLAQELADRFPIESEYEDEEEEEGDGTYAGRFRGRESND